MFNSKMSTLITGKRIYKMTDTNATEIKIIVVGDGTVGKTALLCSYRDKQFPDEYVPTIFETHCEVVAVHGVFYDVKLIDTAGQEDYERLRTMNYQKTDCFILCYAVDNKTSYENIKTKWYPELRRFSKTVPILLLATKVDLRHRIDAGECLSTSKGRKLKNKLNLNMFMECSAKEQENVKAVMREAARLGIESRSGKKNSCFVM